MIIAIPYENEQIYQHFGRTTIFAIYEIEDGKILDRNLVNTNGKMRHEVLDVLDENDVDVILCGHMGEHMMDHCKEHGFVVYGGLEGDVQDALEDYLDNCLEYQFHILPQKKEMLFS